jgi:hypothetical protein
VLPQAELLALAAEANASYTTCLPSKQKRAATSPHAAGSIALDVTLAPRSCFLDGDT